VIAGLRQIALSEELPDIYHVHHGSISAQLREASGDVQLYGRSPLQHSLFELTLVSWNE